MTVGLSALALPSPDPELFVVLAMERLLDTLNILNAPAMELRGHHDIINCNC